MTLPPLLIVKTGTTHPAVRRSEGDYEDWFVTALESGRQRAEVLAVEEASLPGDPRRWGGIILTGSPLSVRDEASWMLPLGEWTLEAAELGVPVLAVCFGHQLVGEVLGGRVGKNPRGPEMGTCEVRLTEAGRSDPLFAGLPEVLQVQQTHSDSLVEPPAPDRATLLASGADCEWQAFAAGPKLRAVQFHPELRAETLRLLLDARGTEGETRASPHGVRMLRNWDERFVRGD